MDFGVTPQDKLHKLLSGIMSDDEIIAGPRFKESGLTKIATKIGVQPGEVAGLIFDLGQALSAEAAHLDEEGDGEVRYTWEDDALGNVTVRDCKTGKEKFLNVQAASSLLKTLDGNSAPEQDVLAKLMNESINVAEPDRELPADEMVFGTSSYNFPWKIDGKVGTGTARFSGVGQNFKVTVISVRDMEGDPVDATPAMMAKLKMIAQDFVHEA